MNYNWTCPDCGEHVIEEVMGGVTQSSTINALSFDEETKQIIADYGEVSCEGGDTETLYYQCQQCGYLIDIDELQTIAKQNIEGR